MLSPSVPGQPLVEPCGPLPDVGSDDVNGNLILREGTRIQLDGRELVIVKQIGEGSFSQVYQVLDPASNLRYALKVGKSNEESREQCDYETQVLNYIKAKFSRHYDVAFFRYYGCFDYHNHRCFLMELFGESLWHMIETGQGGVGFKLIQEVLHDILRSLVIFEQCRIVHCDIKPENIVRSLDNQLQFRLIDYGLCSNVRSVKSGCCGSTYYRAPEVIVNYRINCKADIWSLGVVIAELFFGLPLFPYKEPMELMYFMNRMVGPFPADFVRRMGREGRIYFLNNGVMKSRERLCKEINVSFSGEHLVFTFPTLLENIMSYEREPGLEMSPREDENRKIFADLLLGMLRLDPDQRLSAAQALEHPFMKLDFSSN